MLMPHILSMSQPNDQQYFVVSSYYEGPQDQSIFVPPSICNPTTTCPTLSVCTVARTMLTFDGF